MSTWDDYPTVDDLWIEVGLDPPGAAQEIVRLRRERDAYKKAKEENDERFQIKGLEIAHERDTYLRLLSAALDEIYSLRIICAYEEGVVKTYTEYKSFPKSRRDVADKQMRRLRAAVAGEAQRVANHELPFTRWLRDKVGLLTVAQWSEEVDRRNPPRRHR